MLKMNKSDTEAVMAKDQEEKDAAEGDAKGKKKKSQNNQGDDRPQDRLFLLIPPELEKARGEESPSSSLLRIPPCSSRNGDAHGPIGMRPIPPSIASPLRNESEHASYRGRLGGGQG